MSTQEAPMGHQVRLHQKLEELGMKELSAGFSMSTMKGAEDYVVIDLHEDVSVSGEDDKVREDDKVMKIIIGLLRNVHSTEDYVLYIPNFSVSEKIDEKYKKRDPRDPRDLIDEFIVYALQEAVYQFTVDDPSKKISYFMRPINISQYASLHHNEHPIYVSSAATPFVFENNLGYDERLLRVLNTHHHPKLYVKDPWYFTDKNKDMAKTILFDEKRKTIAETTFCIEPVTTFDGDTVKKEKIILVVSRSHYVNFNDGDLLLDEFFVWSLKIVQDNYWARQSERISFYANLVNISEYVSEHVSKHSSSPFRSKAKHRQLTSLSRRKTKSRRKSRNGKKSSLKKKRHNV